MADDVISPPGSQERSYEARKSSGRSGAVEVRVRAERRRNWTPDDRLRIVRETLEPGAVAKAVADRHGISTGLLFTWRKQLLATAMSGFSAVQVVPEVPSLEGPPRAEAEGFSSEATPPIIEVTFASGVSVAAAAHCGAEWCCDASAGWAGRYRRGSQRLRTLIRLLV
ncbi:transposase [Muricoccus nepalensis]|nr:transposase [Roseomonas nepalensis]